MAEAETKEAHTPGPWMVVNTDRRNDWGAGLRAGHRSRVMLIESPFTSVVTNRGVARPASSEGAANARLIAAAPCLLAALKEAKATLSMMKRNVENEIARHDGLYRWEGVPAAIQSRIDECQAAIQRAEA